LNQTEIGPEKLAAYRATHYRFGTGSVAVTMRIDVPCEELHRLYGDTGRTCGVFITGLNPFGQQQSEAANEAAHARLGQQLRALTRHVFDGEGVDPGGDWPPEKSYFALGIDAAKARELGTDFNQDAVVWTGPDRVPLLLLLR